MRWGEPPRQPGEAPPASVPRATAGPPPAPPPGPRMGRGGAPPALSDWLRLLGRRAAIGPRGCLARGRARWGGGGWKLLEVRGRCGRAGGLWRGRGDQGARALSGAVGDAGARAGGGPSRSPPPAPPRPRPAPPRPRAARGQARRLHPHPRRRRAQRAGERRGRPER